MFKQKGFLKILSTFLFVVMVIALIPTKITSAAALPGKPKLSANQWGTDVDGDYDIYIDMWNGENATSYKLHERIGIKGEFKVVSEGKLTANTPNPQSLTVPIRGRQAVGVYSYYVEFINNNGSTNSDIFKVVVGSYGKQDILIDTIDDAGVQTQYTMKPGTAKFKLTNINLSNSSFNVISNNTSVAKATIESNNTLSIEAISSGRTGLKIIDTKTGAIRNIGIRVTDEKGTLPGMPDYMSLGQVSEDTANDLDFWKSTSNDDTNKRTDIRYIYINGGSDPNKNWQSWTSVRGARARDYITNSKQLGMIPFFVFYNIPDVDESYDIDLKHINDKAYMEAYFKDLKYFLDICKEVGGDDTIGMIFEPDFLGYMMQKSGKQPYEISAIVEAAYSSGVLDKDKDPKFDNTVTGLVQSINYTVKKYYPEAYFGWQFNTWAYDSHEIPGQGLMHKTEFIGWDAGRQFIKQVAQETAQYYNNAGIASYGANFISIDKYGLDGGYESGAGTDPEKSKWLWNSDLWSNYLLYVKTLHEETKLPAILWQIPVGRVNSTLEENPYNNGTFPDLDNTAGRFEDSAPQYFFGDSFKPGSQKRLDYFAKSEANDPKITVKGDTVTWGGHMEEARDAGIVSILYGAGVNGSTDAVGSPPTDSNWWITKAQRYYKNPLPLNGGSVTPPPVVDKPSKATLSVDKQSNNGTFNMTVKIPANSKATSYTLFENGKSVKTGSVTSAAETVTYRAVNYPTGTYMYNVVLYNKDGQTSSDNLTVTVNNNVVPPVQVPLKGSLSVDKATNDGVYNITLNIPSNSFATSYNLYEGVKIVKTGTVTNAAASIVVPFNNTTAGTYSYKLDLVNKDGTTSSDILNVTVEASVTPPPTTGLTVDFAVTSDWGSGANYVLTITNNTGADISAWNITFDFAKAINSSWDADFKASGNTFTFSNKPWNGTIAKGKSLSIGGACMGNVQNLKPTNIKVSYK